MATATSSFIWLPENVPEDIVGDGVLQIPPGIHSLAGFRRWLHSEEFPEKLRAHFIHGNIYLDMSQEAIQTHVLVKAPIKEGWQQSRVFGHDFQLVRQRNRPGAWHYELLVKP